jgi:hypothetical protein
VRQQTERLDRGAALGQGPFVEVLSMAVLAEKSKQLMQSRQREMMSSTHHLMHQHQHEQHILQPQHFPQQQVQKSINYLDRRFYVSTKSRVGVG